MKNLLKLILILIPIFTIGQSQQDSLENRINFLKQKSHENEITKTENQELLNYGYAMQGRGMLYEMNDQDYEKALPPLDSAITFWNSIKDIKNEANILKYRCQILGYLERFDEAKRDFKRAVILFNKAGLDFGVAVSQYDMAIVYDLENKLDSALFYQLKAVKFWTEKKATSRIIGNNTLLMQIYYRMEDYEKAIEIQKSMDELVTEESIWQTSLDFYYVSYQLYEETEENDKAVSYKKLYDHKIHEIRKKDIKAQSKYVRK